MKLQKLQLTERSDYKIGEITMTKNEKQKRGEKMKVSKIFKEWLKRWIKDASSKQVNQTEEWLKRQSSDTL